MNPVLSRLVMAALLALGCTDPRSAHDAQRDNPLGPSFWIVPTPSEDAALLGRTFSTVPDTSWSLEEQSRPNPCADALREESPANMQNRYHDAIDVASSAEGQALLGLFGFSADAASASHLLYQVTTSRKLTRLDTTEYEQCCATNDCGWGYVSALIYGEGEYVSAQQAAAAAGGSYRLITARGTTTYRALSRKSIRGWLAAIITAHDRTERARACALDEQWQGFECVSKLMIQAQRDWCATDAWRDPFWADSPDVQFRRKQWQADACRWLDDHGVERIRR